MEKPGVGIVFQVGTETFLDDAPAECRIQNRKRDFDPSKKVSIHPVGAREKNSVVAVVEEIENSAVLEKSSDDGPHADMFRKAGDAGP